MKNIFLSIILLNIVYAVFAQNVGINESSPNARLVIKGSASLLENSLLVKDANNIPLIAVANSGRLGINISNPQAPLHVYSSTAGELLRLRGVNPFLSFYNQSDIYSGYLWSKSSGMELGTPLGSNLPVTIAPGRLVNTTFTAGGNVGIGVQNPFYQLEVNGRMRILNNTETAGIWFNNTTNTSTTGFAGVFDDKLYGFYGNPTGWTLLLNAGNGHSAFGTTPDAGARLTVEGNDVALYTRATSPTATALKIGTGKLVGEGAGIGTATSIFVHKATDANSTNTGGVHLGYTVIDNPYCNNNPSAILIVTLNGTYGPGVLFGYERIPEAGYGSIQVSTITSCMVFYNGLNSDFYFSGPVFARNRWCIRAYNSGYVAEPVPFNFNVMVFQPG